MVIARKSDRGPTLRLDVTRRDSTLLMSELRGHARAWWFAAVLDALLSAAARLESGRSTTTVLEVDAAPGAAFHEWLRYAALRARDDPATARALTRIHRSRR